MQSSDLPFSKLRVAAVQMSFADTIEGNISKISKSVSQAKRRKADVVLFPECATTGYNTDFSSLEAIQTREALNAVSQFASDHQINLLIGSPLFHQRNLYNALLAFNRSGRPVHAYAKCQLTPGDKAHFTPGNSISYFQVDGIPVTSMICHERRYPELVRIPIMAGARIIFHPNAGLDSKSVSNGKRGGKDGMAVRAFENAAHYLFANSVGSQGNHLWSAGDSKIIDAGGKTLALAGNNDEEIIVATLNLESATRKYALDSMQHPKFLSSHWKSIVKDAKKQAKRESIKLLSEL